MNVHHTAAPAPDDRGPDSVEIAPAVAAVIVPQFEQHVDHMWEFIRRDCTIIIPTSLPQRRTPRAGVCVDALQSVGTSNPCYLLKQ